MTDTTPAQAMTLRDFSARQVDSAEADVRAALQSIWFNQNSSMVKNLLSGDNLHSLIFDLYGGEEAVDTITGGRTLERWHLDSFKPRTAGGTGVFELCEAISRNRVMKRKNLYELSPEAISTIAMGLYAVMENTDITAHKTLMSAILNIYADDTPHASQTHPRAKADRTASSNFELMGQVDFSTEGRQEWILQPVRKRGLWLKASRVSFDVVHTEPVQLLKQDTEILFTALAVALAHKEVTKLQTQYVFTDEQIAKAYFPRMAKVTPQAVETITQSLERLSKVSMDNVNLSEAVKNKRLSVSAELRSYPLWTADRARVYQWEKSGKREAGVELPDTLKKVDGWVLTRFPLLFAFDADLSRVRTVSRDLRPSLRYDPRTEEIFIVLARYLRQVAYSVNHIKGLELDTFYLPSDTEKTRATVRDTVEDILHHWEVNKFCTVVRTMGTNRNGTEFLSSFSLGLPATDGKGRVFEDSPEGKKEAADYLVGRVETPWNSQEVSVQ